MKANKLFAGLLTGTLLLSGSLLAGCSTQAAAGTPTQAITSSQELMASGAKSDSVPVSTVAQPSGDNAASAQSADIGEEKAKEIALTHAGVAEADTSGLWIKRDFDDGRLEYEVEFYVGNKEYDYEIAGADGTVLSYDYDLEHAERGSRTASATPSAASQPSAATQPSAASQPSSTGISLDQAKQIALGQVPGADDSHIRIETDRDDGQLLYEGKIVYNGVEYEFEINASDGSIREWSVDQD
ncbi:MAG: PepSY domain-containing protein [Eubacteriales bacterium]|nr:PepSY domain-containing protein [Eubacteriales bacterium]